MATGEQAIARQQAEQSARDAFVRNVLPFSGGEATRPDLREEEMSVEDALALKAAGGGGRRQVLTPAGWLRVDGIE